MVQSQSQSVTMFKAIKKLKIPMRKGNSIIHNKIGQGITNKKRTMKQSQENQSSPIIGEQKLLIMQIRKYKIRIAVMHKTRSNKSEGGRQQNFNEANEVCNRKYKK